MWYSSADQSWAKNTLTRDVAVPAGATDARFWMWNNFHIEEDWDYGFVEVSTDGGTTWTEQKVRNAAGAEVSTPDGYADPNGRMADYGNKKYGLTGATDDWEHHYVDVTAYAGQNIKVRMLYATDAGFEDTGWFVDDLSLTNGGNHRVERRRRGQQRLDRHGRHLRRQHRRRLGARLGHVAERAVLPRGVAQLRRVRQGPAVRLRHDLPEARWGRCVEGREDQVQRARCPRLVPRHGYGDVNHILNNLTSLPSEGAKGGLLIVDSHFDPLRRTGANAALDPSTLKNLPSRPQSSNAAFNLVGTYPFKECQTKADFTGEVCNTFPAQGAVKSFTDNKGWYPGIEIRDGSLFYRDADASTVVPSRGNQPYSTRVVDANGNPLPQYYGLDIGLVTPARHGQPCR